EARACGDQPMPIALGIGLNCLQQPAHWPADLDGHATSLEIESRQPIDRLCIARALMRQLDRVFAEGPGAGNAEIAAAWQERSADIGRRVTVSCNGRRYSGRVVDVSPERGLLLQEDTGSRRAFDLAAI